MKYLKGYNERLSQDNRSNIQEILSELIDNVKPKLWVVYSDNGNFGDSKSNPPTVGGYYTHDNYSFHYTNLNDFIKLLSDFKDSIPRLESYCKDEDIKLSYSASTGLFISFVTKTNFPSITNDWKHFRGDIIGK